MSTNVLAFIENLSRVTNFNLVDLYPGTNRINNVGVALEDFLKDVFCNTVSVIDIQEKQRAYATNLSYAGNTNNPPDFILRGGDAVEVKKINSDTSTIALNSSYPKAKLLSRDTRISAACRESEGGQWQEKDIIYAVGSVSESQLSTLWLVYGDCYAADAAVYERSVTAITTHLSSVDTIELSPTNELARINRVDPLGLTYLRVRGMWGIESPQRVFGQYVDHDATKRFSAYIMMRTQKYESFSSAERDRLENNPLIHISDITIPSPNNPVEPLSVKLLSYSVR